MLELDLLGRAAFHLFSRSCTGAQQGLHPSRGRQVVRGGQEGRYSHRLTLRATVKVKVNADHLHLARCERNGLLTWCAPNCRSRTPWISRSAFGIDLEHCPQCGGELKIIAAIEDPVVIVRILKHLGLPACAPPRAPARPLSLFQAA